MQQRLQHCQATTSVANNTGITNTGAHVRARRARMCSCVCVVLEYSKVRAQCYNGTRPTTQRLYAEAWLHPIAVLHLGA